MESFARVQAYLRELEGACQLTTLSGLLAEIARDLGFRYFAVSHHVDICRASGKAIRLHNYPEDWAQFYDENSLGPSDPVHRASHRQTAGFAWSDIPGLIELTPRDRDMLVRASRKGIGDGFTVPANIPGEASGSCSFANPPGQKLPVEHLPVAQLIGTYAFDAARRLWRNGRQPERARITERQLECVLWVARGKTAWEIGRILGVEEDTIEKHLRDARLRCGAVNGTTLVIRALRSGAISLEEIERH